MKLTYFKDGEPKYSMSVWEVHHYYTGYLAFILFGFLEFQALFVWSDFWVWFFLIGMAVSLWVIADDWIQHRIQRKELKEKGFYTTRSFWHWIFYKKYWN